MKMNTQTQIRALVSLVALAFASATTGLQAVTVSISSTAPNESGLVASFVASEINSWGVRSTAGNGRDISQSFYIGNNDVILNSFTFRQSATANSSGTSSLADFYVQILKLKTAGAIPGSANVEEVVFSKTSKWGFWVPTIEKGSYITFTLGSVPLEANACYSFVVGFRTADANGFLASASGNGTAYNGVALFNNYGNDSETPNWSDSSTDLIFYATGTAAAVPEPATTAVLLGTLAIAAAALALHKRR